MSEPENPKKGLDSRLREIGVVTASLMMDGRTSRESMDELQDEETGLPK